MRTYKRLFISFISVLALAGPAAAVCGDGVLDSGEQCDLAVANCAPGVCCETSCDSSCQLIGHCTGSEACCSNDSQCTSGEGCCGNAVVEGDEECDDGNQVDGDCCSTSCTIETAPCVPLPPECGALGPLNVLGNPSIRRIVLRDSRPIDGQFDMFARNRFVLPDGLDIDPDTEVVSLFLTQNDGNNGNTDLYGAILDPQQCAGGQCFDVKTNSFGLDKKWEYRRSTPISGAQGWDLSRFTRNLGFPSQITVANTLRDTPIGEPLQADGVRRARFSVVIGDICMTRLLDCERNNRYTRFTCREIHCGDGQINRGEQCGEPGLSCRGGKACDSCRCYPASSVRP
jgi:cysteine-rich repeat protein